LRTNHLSVPSTLVITATTQEAAVSMPRTLPIVIRAGSTASGLVCVKADVG
jgi:hypothetical protein